MDDELLAKWRSGDASAGQTLFSRHFEAIYRFFANKCEEPDELVQATFLACLRAREHFRQESSFRTYLFVVARNELYQHYRRQRKHTIVDPETSGLAHVTTTPASKITRCERRQALLTALRSLPLAQQTLLELHYWEQLDAAELAQIFDTSATAIRVRLHRARQALRQTLGADASVSAIHLRA